MQSSASPGPASSSSWKLRICPTKPFNEVPFLLSTSPSTSLLSLRSRVAKVLQKYTDVKEELVLLFVSQDGIDFALVEDSPIEELFQNGEKIVVRRDEALWLKDTLKKGVESNGKRLRTEHDDEEPEEDVLIEANRIAQKIKSEIGPRSKKYEEVDWPSAPPIVRAVPSASTMALPMISSMPTSEATAALQAFEQKKKAMQIVTAKKASIGNGNRASLSSAASSSASSSSSSSSLSSSSSSDSSSASDASSSDSSSSSQSSNSDSSSSSSDDRSSSDSGSSSVSELPPAPPNGQISGQNGISTQDWVPPGHGLARTQRNNRSRRQKRKAEEEEKQVKLFQEAKVRAEKRQKGEAVDEAATTEAWMIDTKGSKANVHSNGAQRYKIVSRDGNLVLPPGGGSLGIPGKKTNGAAARETDGKSVKKLAEQRSEQAKAGTRYVPAAREVPEEAPAVQYATEDITSCFSHSRVPPPPSQRNTAIPAGVRLTSVDCDGYYNGLEEEVEIDDENDEVSEAYAAFQAQAKASLKAAKEAEEEKEKEMMLVQQDQLHSKDKTTQGLTEIERQAHPPAYNGGRSNNQSDKAETYMEEAQSFMSDLPLEFGKKSDWDGNDVVVARQHQLLQPANSVLELDYGEPDETLTTSTSYHEDLRRLRDLSKTLRDQAQAGKSLEVADDLQKARAIALASRKKAR